MTEFEQAQIGELKRIADALENIGGFFQSFDDCIGMLPKETETFPMKFIRIAANVTGEITTDRY